MLEHMRELYQETILDHNKHARNRRTIDNASRTAQGFNPLCGDKLTLYLMIVDDKIIDVAFQGQGCAISTASASLMTESIKNKTLAETQQLFEQFHHAMIEQDVSLEKLGKLAVLAGVKEFPARVKCATLAWHTLDAALHQQSTPVSTE